MPLTLHRSFRKTQNPKVGDWILGSIGKGVRNLKANKGVKFGNFGNGGNGGKKKVIFDDSLESNR